MISFADYDKYDGLGLAELVHSREVKPSELVEEAISRIEKLNPQLNAVIYKMYEQARKAAAGDPPDGPFKGVPFLLKDLLMSYAGVPHCLNGPFSRDCETCTSYLNLMPTLLTQQIMQPFPARPTAVQYEFHRTQN